MRIPKLYFYVFVQNIIKIRMVWELRSLNAAIQKLSELDQTVETVIVAGEDPTVMLNDLQDSSKARQDIITVIDQLASDIKKSLD